MSIPDEVDATDPVSALQNATVAQRPAFIPEPSKEVEGEDEIPVLERALNQPKVKMKYLYWRALNQLKVKMKYLYWKVLNQLKAKMKYLYWKVLNQLKVKMKYLYWKVLNQLKVKMKYLYWKVLNQLKVMKNEYIDPKSSQRSQECC